MSERYCTECPYFKNLIVDDESWYGAKCNKDGHMTLPSMYAIQSLHDDCPYKAENKGESEVKK